MAVVKNMIVRVGADMSGLLSGFKKGGGATESFAKQASKALRNTTLSEANLKKAMAQGGKNASITSLVDQIRELEAEQKALKDLGFSWGYEGFEKNEALLRSLNSELNEYKTTLSTPDINVNVLAENLRTAVDEAGSLGLKLQIAQKSLKELEFYGLGAGDADWDDMYRTVSLLTQKVKDYKDSLVDVGRSTEMVSQKTNRLGTSAESAANCFGKSGTKILGMGKSSKTAASSMVGLLRSIKRLGVVAIGARLVTAIFGELSSVVSQYASENAALQAQINTLKSSFGAALAPAINLVTNALSKLMPYIVGVSNAIGTLIANLAGSGWTSVSAGANAAATAIGGASAAQKEFNRTLQGFDEISKLDTKDGGGGGASTVTAPVVGKTPAWMTSLTSKVEASIKDGDWFGVGSAIADSLNEGIDAVSGMDESIGSKIAGWINNGVSLVGGFLSTTEWEDLGNVLLTNVVDLFTGIDFKAISHGLGAVVGQLSTWIVDAMGTLSEYLEGSYGFDFGNDVCGLITMGIADAFKNVGAWAYDNILLPLVDGFKSTFKIHSPATHPEITGVGENIMLGILNGILEPLKDPAEWIKNNIFTPLTQGFASVFGKDSLLGKSASQLFFGNASFGGNVTVEAEAKITSVKDAVMSKTISGGSLLIQNIRDQVKNKTFDNGSLQIRNVADKAISKIFGGGRLNITSVTDQASNKTFGGGRLNITSIVDQAASKSLGAGKLQITSISDQTADKTLKNGRLSVNSWVDNIRDKTFTVFANVAKGWSGSLASALGIGSITSKLNLKLPKISIDWAYVTVGKSTFKYPKGFDVKWNAKGLIMNGAQIFGRAGNTFLGGGEAGREALLPLDRNTWWMDKIADRVALRVVGGGTGGEQSITVNLVVDGKILASTVVRHVNAQARATGRNPLAAYM